MILLFGLPDDPPIAAVRARLAQQRGNALMLDQRDVLATSAEMRFERDVSGWVSWGGVRVDLNEVEAAYLRPYDPTAVESVSRVGRDSPEGRHAVEVYEAIRVWSELSDACIVNRLSAMASNGSKPYQAELIRRAGFAVPTTLLTTDPERALAFVEEHGQVIYKSLSGVRSIVSRLNADMRQRLSLVANCPTQLQRYVPGFDVRVHVIGDEHVACRIVSDADDYRYASRQGRRLELEPFALPLDCAERCRALAAELGLLMAGVDLRCTPEGEWVCFEVNPSPGFTFFETPDGRIASSLVRLMTSKRRGAA